MSEVPAHEHAAARDARRHQKAMVDLRCSRSRRYCRPLRGRVRLKTSCQGSPRPAYGRSFEPLALVPAQGAKKGGALGEPQARRRACACSGSVIAPLWPGQRGALFTRHKLSRCRAKTSETASAARPTVQTRDLWRRPPPPVRAPFGPRSSSAALPEITLVEPGGRREAHISRVPQGSGLRDTALGSGVRVTSRQQFSSRRGSSTAAKPGFLPKWTSII
jgi:hypothetical protein